MRTSEPPPESRVWLTLYFVQLPLFLYQLLNSAFHNSTEDTKKIPLLKISLLAWKNSSHLCFIKIAECIKKKSRSGWITKMRNLSFEKNSLGWMYKLFKIKTWKKHAMASQSITTILLLYAFLLAEKFFCFSDEIQLIKN